jgi:hypothetical protein
MGMSKNLFKAQHKIQQTATLERLRKAEEDESAFQLQKLNSFPEQNNQVTSLPIKTLDEEENDFDVGLKDAPIKIQ